MWRRTCIKSKNGPNEGGEEQIKAEKRNWSIGKRGFCLLDEEELPDDEIRIRWRKSAIKGPEWIN